MLIRTEAPADILPIDSLLKAAFDTSAEANLVMRLRENSRFTLSLVACNDEGEVVGHLLFSPVTLEGDDFGWQGLAPIAVREDYRGQGLAKELIQEGLESLAEFGYLACVVLGAPDFYGKFGFNAASKFGMQCEWEEAQHAFQFIELQQGVADKKQGLIKYSPEFSELD